MATGRVPTYAAVLLAAGESSRMGEPKALLAWGRRTLIEHQVRELERSGVEPVVVVLGHRAGDLRPAAERAGDATGTRIVIHPGYRQGKTTSIRAGLEALESAHAGIFVLGVDQPCEAASLRALIEGHRSSGAPVVVPTHGGRRGHPALFDGRLRPGLDAISEEREGLREILRKHASEVLEVPVASHLVLADLNRPEDYERARPR